MRVLPAASVPLMLLLAVLSGCTETNEEIERQTTDRMHPSWDADGDGINDCELDGSCDHTVDYSLPRPL